MSAAEEEAKKHTGMTGDDKLKFALAAIEGACKAANIKLDTKALNDLDAYIKQMCAWAKTVNAGKTAKK
jgi:molybdenum cofactor biosynthesis enzyme MoaA